MDRTALLPQRFHKEVNYHQKEKRRKGSFKVAQEQLPRSKGNYEEDKKDQERCSQLIHGRNCTPSNSGTAYSITALPANANFITKIFAGDKFHLSRNLVYLSPYLAKKPADAGFFISVPKQRLNLLHIFRLGPLWPLDDVKGYFVAFG
jgi:hypothetical protein